MDARRRAPSSFVWGQPQTLDFGTGKVGEPIAYTGRF